MKKQSIIIVVLIASFLLSVPLASAAGAVVKPTLTMPNSNWAFSSESAYPNEPSEHDPKGSGEITYENSVTYDFVMVYYEQAIDANPTQSSLQADVEHIFARDHPNDVMAESGIMTIAGVQAGYAKGYNASVGAYGVVLLETAFVKGSDYFNVFAYYDHNSESETQVTSLMNSITVAESPTATPTPTALILTPTPTPSHAPTAPPTPTPTPTPTAQQGIQSYLIYIIAVVVIVVVAVVVLLVVLRKRKSKPVQTAQPTFASQPPPPPPPPT
jgi:hypothetical protein